MTTPLSPPPSLDPVLFDTREWPVVYGRFPELDEPDRVDRILGSLDRLLDHQQPFVMVWIPPRHDHDDEPHEDEKRSVVWLKQRKDMLRRLCAGYVYETADPTLQALLEGRLQTVRKLYGFPMVVVSDRDSARRQAQAMLRG